MSADAITERELFIYKIKNKTFKGFLFTWLFIDSEQAPSIVGLLGPKNKSFLSEAERTLVFHQNNETGRGKHIRTSTIISRKLVTREKEEYIIVETLNSVYLCYKADATNKQTWNQLKLWGKNVS